LVWEPEKLRGYVDNRLYEFISAWYGNTADYPALLLIEVFICRSMARTAGISPADPTLPTKESSHSIKSKKKGSDLLAPPSFA